MRKFRLLSLLLIVGILFTACTAQSAPAAEPAAEEAAPAADEAAEAPAAEEEKAEEAAAEGEEVTLIIESWRNDDITIWQDTIIPAFEASHPGIKVVFSPSAPAEYNGILNTKLEGGTAGDLITARPFDASLELFNQGYLASLSDLPGMENFGPVAKSAWITDDGSEVFAVPMASVLHGFFYNKDAFAEVGVEAPTTKAEFMEVLEAIKADGTYIPLAMGTADLWEAATMGFQNIGPNNWAGEAGRLALLDGSGKYTDAPYIKTWQELADWAPYLPEGYEAVKYADSQSLFTLGKAAIYPTGSWEISVFEPVSDFELGVFPPPVDNEGDTCYVSDQTDIAMGMNAATEHPEEARIFLEWMTGEEFASLYSNALPGFFTLSDHMVQLEDPLAMEFMSWRGLCESSLRNSYQILSRGEPNLENELWRVSAAVMNGTMTPEQAGEEIQAGLDSWYVPAE